MVADPSTVKFNGNPDIVGMMMLLSKNTSNQGKLLLNVKVLILQLSK
jgi:hypothetical protein